MEFSQIKASFTQQAFRVLPGAVLPHLRQQLPQDHVYGSSNNKNFTPNSVTVHQTSSQYPHFVTEFGVLIQTLGYFGRFVTEFRD